MNPFILRSETQACGASSCALIHALAAAWGYLLSAACFAGTYPEDHQFYVGTRRRKEKGVWVYAAGRNLPKTASC